VTNPGKMMVSLYGWLTQEKWWSHCMGDEPKKNDGLIVWVTNPRKMMVSLYGWRTQEKWWSHCMGDLPKKNNVENGLIMMGDLPKWKEFEVRSHYNGWLTQVEDRKNVKWSCYNGWPTQVEDRKNMKWSHCYGWPTQVEDRKNMKRSHCNGWPTQMEDEKNMKRSHYYGWPTQMKDVMWQVWKMGLTWRSPEGMIEEGPENLVLLDNSWSQGLKTRCFLIARLIFSFLWDFPNNKVYLIFFPFQCLNHGSLLLSAQWFSLFFFSLFFWSPILLSYIEDFSCNKIKNMYNVLTLADMHASLPDSKYRSPLFDVPSSQGAFVCIPKLYLSFPCTDSLVC
jgi:hypothetical protein